VDIFSIRSNHLLIIICSIIQRFSSGLNGTWAIVHVATKIHVGLADHHVADFYYAMLVQVFLDSLMLFFMFRAGSDLFQPIYLILAGFVLVYEIYTFYQAGKAHLALLIEKEKES
jgi:hypothetical protein